MAEKTLNRLPIKLTIDKDDLDSEDEIPHVNEIKKEKPIKEHVKPKIHLASSINPGIKCLSYYVDVNPGTLNREKPPVSAVVTEEPAAKKLNDETSVDKLMEKSVIKPGFEKLEAVPSYSEGQRRLKLLRRKEAEKTKGDQWFNLPATEMTEQRLRDLEIIQMRSILNPKQFYKKNDFKVLPKYFQVGTVVDNAADFYSSRVPKKDRKKTLVDELMADANFQKFNKRKYAEIIQTKHQVSGAHKRSRRLKKRK